MNRRSLRRRSSYNRWRMQNKHMVLWHYSHGTLACKSCGNPDARVLTIDHIMGGGCAHRKEIVNRPGGPSGTEFFIWLIKNNFPEGYQVLCFNCNCTKGAPIITNESIVSGIKQRLRLEELPVQLDGLITIKTDSVCSAMVRAHYTKKSIMSCQGGKS